MFSSAFSRTTAIIFAICAGFASPALAGGVATSLTLINGWQNGPSGTADASVIAINGVVHFKGAISQSGDSQYPFVLPAPFRPAAPIYIPIDACKATNARLDITTDGVVAVEAERNLDKAKCLVSLDGVTYSLTTDGFKPLKLLHKWVPYGEGLAAAAVNTIDGMVTLQGAIATNGRTDFPFTLPKAYRPSTTVYVKVDLCDATNGRLDIDPDGRVLVQAEKKFSNAKCFTSLDGVYFPLSSNGFTNLDLINGWENAVSGRPSSVNLVNGIVHFEGAIETSGSDPKPFVLPANFRPSNTVYLPVDMCNATNGRIVITPNGTATVTAEKDFNNAACFTSLEGVSFSK